MHQRPPPPRLRRGRAEPPTHRGRVGLVSERTQTSGDPISALDAAHMMLLLKVARSCYTPTRDNYVDMAGYARCAAEIAGFEENDGVVPSDLYEEGD